jgi:hypothetical protein
MVVTVNVPVCLRCLRPEGEGRDPYDSLKGMRAVIDGLRPRAALRFGLPRLRRMLPD